MSDAVPSKESAAQFCEARVREADKDRYLAALFAPQQHRGALFALYAFDIEIAQVRDRVSSPLPGEVRLQWWGDVLNADAPGDAAGSPIAAALLDAVRRYELPVPALLDLIEARTFDLYDEPMAALSTFEDYAARTSGAVIGLAAHMLNAGQAVSSRHAGVAIGFVRALQQLPLHAARGQQFVPDDVLLRHGATAADLRAGRVTGPWRSALSELRQAARRHLATLAAEIPRLPPAVLPALLPVAVLPEILRCMDAAGYDPLHPPTVPQWRRQWRLWRAARDPRRIAG